MNYLIAKINNIPFSVVKEILENDESFFNLQGIHVENIWHNVDDIKEVYFLARIENINNTKKFVEKMRSATLLVDPNAAVAEMTYLSN